jgi:hypothetical protein
MLTKFKNIASAAILSLSTLFGPLSPLPALAAYDMPTSIIMDFSYPALDWHSGTLTRYGSCPAGMFGVVQSVFISPTTSFVGTTTPAAVQVGYGSAAQLYAWANVLAGSTLNVTTTNGSPTVTLNSITTGYPVIGDAVTGTGIAAASVITAITTTGVGSNQTTTLTLNNNANASGTNGVVTAAQVATPRNANTYAQGLTQLGSAGIIAATSGVQPSPAPVNIGVAAGAGYMPINTPFIFTFVPSTGGGVAGVADVIIRVKCF